ncbi:MAG: exosortase K [Desulfofustis sp.]|nr:exosortase K [Desulfofustis sp.]
MKAAARLARMRGAQAGVAAATLGIAVMVKLFYRDADSRALAWLLGPTAMLVEALTGIEFSHVPGSGWLSQTHWVVIAPACAGVNYLVIAFCMSAFQGIAALRRTPALTGWLVFSGLSAVVVTVLVNSLRIWLSLRAFRSDPAGGLLSAEALHRLTGVVVYYVFLFFHYQLVSYMLRVVAGLRTATIPVFPGLIPLFWYLLVTLLVPIIHRSELLASERFIRHGGTVFLTSLVLALALGALWTGTRVPGRRSGAVRNGDQPL